MIQGIDHLVIACADPDAAADELSSALGLAVTGGGRHAGRGTFNRIAWLADGSYLELIGVDDREAALRQPVGAASVRTLDSAGAGLATYALRDDDLERSAAALVARGTYGAVEHGSRLRDDGEVVEWWTAFPTRGLAPDRAPFLIEHAHVGAEWGPSALAERAAFRHPIGSPVVLVGLDIAATDPPATAAAIEEGLGLELRSAADLAVARFGSHLLRIVREREMAVPAAVRLAAEVEAPRTAELLGLRFDVEPIGVAAAEPA